MRHQQIIYKFKGRVTIRFQQVLDTPASRIMIIFWNERRFRAIYAALFISLCEQALTADCKEIWMRETQLRKIFSTENVLFVFIVSWSEKPTGNIKSVPEAGTSSWNPLRNNAWTSLTTVRASNQCNKTTNKSVVVCLNSYELKQVSDCR